MGISFERMLQKSLAKTCRAKIKYLVWKNEGKALVTFAGHSSVLFILLLNVIARKEERRRKKEGKELSISIFVNIVHIHTLSKKS
jgi:hypothetical protein